MSQESGIPTFRDRQTGLWANFDAAELATPASFERDAGFVWAWYEWRGAAVRRGAPNAAHRAIAKLAGSVPELTLVTQKNATGIEECVTFALRGPAGGVLPALLERAWP